MLLFVKKKAENTLSSCSRHKTHSISGLFNQIRGSRMSGAIQLPPIRLLSMDTDKSTFFLPSTFHVFMRILATPNPPTVFIFPFTWNVHSQLKITLSNRLVFNHLEHFHAKFLTSLFIRISVTAGNTRLQVTNNTQSRQHAQPEQTRYSIYNAYLEHVNTYIAINITIARSPKAISEN